MSSLSESINSSTRTTAVKLVFLDIFFVKLTQNTAGIYEKKTFVLNGPKTEKLGYDGHNIGLD